MVRFGQLYYKSDHNGYYRPNSRGVATSRFGSRLISKVVMNIFICVSDSGGNSAMRLSSLQLLGA